MSDYYPPAPEPQWGPPPQSGSSGKATASLILGIVGVLICPLICSILALVFGYQARGEIEASGDTISGRGLATAGIVLGYVGIAFGVLGIIIFAAGN